MIEVGSIIGNYRILEEVGVGGMGKVFRGVDTMLARDVAIKVLRPELTREKSLVDRFRNEAMVLAKLNHPHIALLYNLIHQDNLLFMVMEFARGETLDLHIKRSGLLPYNQAIRLFGQISEAIDYAHHHGVVHRDLKPSNIMITPEEGVKVMDFGIARVLGTERMTREGSLIGTLEYMAPEQIRGHESSERTDIYSLGILLYEMLSGKLPFSCANQYDLMRAHIETPPTPPRSYAPHVPEHVEEAILRALAKDPFSRFTTAIEFCEALLRGEPSIHAGHTGSPSRRIRETLAQGPKFETEQIQSEEELRREAGEIAAETRRRLIAEARKKGGQEAAKHAEAERQKLIDEACEQAEQEAALLAEEERRRLIDEARKEAEQEATQRAAALRQRLLDEARKQAEEEAARLAGIERQVLIAEARKQAEQEAAQRAAAERQRLLDEARKQAEEEAARLFEEERKRLVEEARKEAEQEAVNRAASERLRLVEEARKEAEQEAAQRAESERLRLVEEARKQAEQDAAHMAAAERQRIVEEARKQAEQEAARLAAAERQRLIEEARKRAEQEAAQRARSERQRLVEEARKQAEQDAARLAAVERQRLIEEARKRAEQEAARFAEEETQRLVEDARKQAEQEAARLEVEERKRLIEKAHKGAEEEAAIRAAAERQRLVEEARKRAEQEASQYASVERQRLVEEARKQAEQEAIHFAAEETQRLIEEALQQAGIEASELAAEERKQLIEEARKRAGQEAAQKVSKERQRLVEVARKQAGEEAARLAEEERQRLVEEGRKQAEEEAARVAGEERQHLLEEARKRAEKEAARQSAKERKRLIAEERKRTKQEVQRQSAEIIAQKDPYSTSLLSEQTQGEGTRRGFLPLLIGGVLIVGAAIAAFYFMRPGTGSTSRITPAIKPEMVRIAGGTFILGRDYPQEAGENYTWSQLQIPAHEVTIQPFEIDRTEVTNAEYAQFVRETEHQPPDDWTGKEPPQGQQQWPVRHVSLEDARRFAEWRSRRDDVTYRLPTEVEWELAAKGQTRNRYPWGNDWANERANLGTDLPRPAGSYTNGASPDGVLDMIGNASEWTSSPVQAYPGNPLITPEMMKEAYGNSFTVRGGSYADLPGGEKPISVTARGFLDPSSKRPYLGFRLVR